MAVQHNVNVSLTEENVQSPPKYTTGWKDGCAVFFYFLITIVLHAAIQECFFDVSTKIKNLNLELYLTLTHFILRPYTDYTFHQ